MTTLASPATNVRPIQNPRLPAKLAVALALAALADWLFYGERIGISLVVFAIALGCGSLLANFPTMDRRQAMLGGLLLIGALIPVIEDVNAASLAILALALGVGLQLTTRHHLSGLGERAVALCDLFLVGPFRFFADAVGIFNLPALTRGFVIWLVPALLGTIFVFLFVAANPVLARWIGLINPGNPASYLSVGRVTFWVVAIAMVWPFIHVKWRRMSIVAKAAAETSAPIAATPSDRIDFLGAATILRSLILFNLLFAVQTVLDAVYLWGNAALPDGVTYASYAHRGAYPLILTALLAAGFVLLTMQPGSPTEKSKVIRPLVYLWVTQNVLLVASAIYRLDLYVQIYLLTYWRVAAFIWMLLVAIGLVLIVARIALKRSDAWLVGANLIAATAMLYVCSLINFAAIIADYNVAHSREVSGSGVIADVNYLAQLGPQALPALERLLQHRTTDPWLVSRRDSLVEQQRLDMASWRSWGFRSWRLQRHLDAEQNKAMG